MLKAASPSQSGVQSNHTSLLTPEVPKAKQRLLLCPSVPVEAAPLSKGKSP